MKLIGKLGFMRYGLLGAIVLSIPLVSGSPAAAQIKCWTSPGSTGVIDEADFAIALFGSAQGRVRSSAPLPSTLDLRYDVVAVDGLFGGDAQQMTVRYRDNGAGARVRVFLRQKPFPDGPITTPLQFDSDAFAPAPGFQVRSVNTACFGGFAFDFLNNVYFVEARLTKTTADGNPALEALQICLTIC